MTGMLFLLRKDQMAVKTKIVRKKKIDDGRRTALGRGVLSYRDILDQPKGKFYLVIEPSPVHSQLFSVDEIEVSDHQIVSKVGGKLVTSFSPLLPWYIVDAGYVDMITTEEMASRSAEDDKLMTNLRKKLYPKDKDDLPIGQYA
jgi:hypothetical protein